ncbi:Caudovirus, tape measure, N-terminal [uncultured Caudovirales phage]|uniref:Caudovirus, tape measure, N-terminal n=1 Tax=uncultured Caudovirales phage TaxID=2100421 RepID=A0A6J5NM79_9CAUD|nr:Caudovirus, tape measure, N-terminal [uncultured Caudovirales phage]
MDGMKVGQIYYDVELNTAAMIRDSRQADSALRGVEFRMGAVALAVKGLVAALALLQMARVADEARLLAARVEVAAGSMERGAEAMNALARISARTQTELAANVQVFTRLNSSIVQMGGTQQDTLRITELLGMAIKVSGASAAEAGSAMTQFGQALGSGNLAGDELRSLLENAPYLMKQLADGIGVPVGALKQLGEEGKLTADVVTTALGKAAAQIETDFKKLPQTFDAAMIALVDQLRAASKAVDDLSGTSAALTGVTRGAAEAVNLLADQLRAASGEANNLGRNDAIGEWSRRTTLVLSYVADAADMTWQTLSVLGRNVAFVFQGVGREIGGIGAQIAAVMRGDLAQAAQIRDQMVADAAATRAALDAADARSLGRQQLAGQAMRERMGAAATADSSGYMDRSDRLARGTAGTLTAPTTADPKAAAKAEAAAQKERDRIAQNYLEEIEGERRFQAEINALKDGQVRLDQERREKAAADEARAEQDRQKNRATAVGFLAESNPIAQLGLELERKSQLMREAAERDKANEELYAQARVQIAQDTGARITAILQQEQLDRLAAQSQLIGATSNLFGSLAGLAKQFGGEQSSTFRALFAVSKGFAIADAGLKLNMAIMQALADPTSLTPVQKMANYAAIASAGGALISNISGINFGGGRQYGGPVSAGSMYRVNETGAPEMFVGSGGRQYLMPTTSGQVVPADELGGGGGWTINVYGAPAGTTASVNNESRTIEIAVARAEANFVNQMRENSGPQFQALTSSTNVRPRM